MSYVNYLGQEIGLIDHGGIKKTKKEGPAEFHKGWRVEGVPPGTLEKAREQHFRAANLARENGEQFKDLDEGAWLMNAHRKPVRGKPYEVPAAARECADLATKAGWLRVEVVEIKKDKSAA